VGTALTEQGTVRERILAAQERMENGLAWFRRWDTLSWLDVEEFIGACVRNAQDQDTLLAYIRDEASNGTPTPAAAEGLKDKLRKSFRRSFETDALSAMGAIVVPHQEHMFSWKVFETDPLAANYGEGEFGRISGPPRKGKTNTACVIMDRWIARGNLAFSNIKNLDGVPGHVYTETGKTLIRAAIAASRAKQRWLWVMDEGAIAGWTNQEWMTRRSRDLNKFIRVVGKLRGNLVMVEQDPRAVPRLIVDWARNTYYCSSEGYVSIDLRGPHLVWRQDVRDFPKTRLPYDSRDIAAFRVDVDVDEMFQAIAGAGDQLAAMLEYIDRPAKAKREGSPGPQPRDPGGHFAPRAAVT